VAPRGSQRALGGDPAVPAVGASSQEAIPASVMTPYGVLAPKDPPPGFGGPEAIPPHRTAIPVRQAIHIPAIPLPTAGASAADVRARGIGPATAERTVRLTPRGELGFLLGRGNAAFVGMVRSVGLLGNVVPVAGQAVMPPTPPPPVATARAGAAVTRMSSRCGIRGKSCPRGDASLILKTSATLGGRTARW
jgi:hypothetical protein